MKRFSATFRVIEMLRLAATPRLPRKKYTTMFGAQGELLCDRFCDPGRPDSVCNRIDRRALLVPFYSS